MSENKLPKYTMMKNANNTPILQDGVSYTIHLVDGRRISNALYNHCAASGQHYFSKGDEVYPLEDVLTHSMLGHDISEDMPPQVLTDTYCGHLIEVTFTSVVPYCKLTQIPDDVYDYLNEDLKGNVTSGVFPDEEKGGGKVRDLVYLADQGKEIVASFEGSWRVVELPYNLMSRILMWWNNGCHAEELDCELFVSYFGREAGEAYYDRWISHYKKNLLDMFGCFVSDHEAGQKFCNMVMAQVEQYEKEVENGKA